MAEDRYEILPPKEPQYEILPAQKSEEYDPTEYEGVAQEFFEGIGSGATKVVQGVAELGALASDALAGTDYHDDVVQGFDSFRDTLGLDPMGIAGAIGEVGTQFVVPGGLAAKGIQALNAVAKAGKAGKFMAGLGAAGAADAVTATSDTTTIGDFFEGGPTETTDLIGLEGEERALEGLMNKAKVGLEGAAGIVAAPYIARGLSATAGAAATAVGQIPGATQVARGIKAGAEKVGSKAAEIEEARRLGTDQGAFKNGVAEALATLRYRGILPESVAESRSLIPGLTEAEVQAADKLTNRLDKQLDTLMKKANKKLAKGSRFAKADAYNAIDKYLTMPDRKAADEMLKLFDDDIGVTLKSMRSHMDELSAKILDSDFLKKNDMVSKDTQKLLSETIRGNLGSYMRRRYRIFEDADYKPTDEALEQAASGFKADAVAVQDELARVAQSARDPRSAQDLGLSEDFKLLGQVTDDQARIARDNFLERYKRQSNKKPFKGTAKVAADKLRTDLFITRSNLKDYQKALLGEVKNPLENYVATVSDMAEFNAVDNYFGTIRAAAEAAPDGIGKLFRNTEGMSPDQIKMIEEEGFVVLGSGRGSSKADKSKPEDILESGWGSLHGFAVPERVYQDLTRTVVGDVGWLGNALRSTYSGFLRVKGGTQYGKTILSPITQIRNVTTASAFAAAQGNVGKGANLYESVGLVFNNLKRMPPEKAAEEFKELQRLGIVNSQAELRELQELVAKGFGYTDEKTVEGIAATRKFGSNLTDNPVLGFIKKKGKGAENLYQAGDDIWKVYNYTFESNKLRNALAKMTPDQQLEYVSRKGVNLPKTQLNVSTERYFDDLNAANVSPISKQLLMGAGQDNFNVLKVIYDDADFALDELSAVLGREVTPRELSLLKQDVTSLTQRALADQPDTITVYRVGDVIGDSPQSYTLNPKYDVESNLPWRTGKGQQLKAYTVKKSDILSSPDITSRGRIGEDEIIIRGDKVKEGKAFDPVDAFIREEAARVVRNTVPNYNLAPEAIRALRRAPVGNFIAFPYEIMRTGVNTIARGIDELADPNVEIQKIGLRRLTGAITTFGLLPAGVSSLAYKTSGVTKEEMDAYQDSLAAPWEKNARLVPIGRHEDGTPKYINYSYSNPYDMLERTAIAAINTYERGMQDGKSSSQVVSEAAFSSLGELMAPFTQEAIALAAFRDVLDPDAENPVMSALGQFGRGGKTITGAKIYNPEDNAGDKVAKSFAHIADTLLPSIIPLDESGGKIEPSRFARGFINGMDLNETLGISEKDRMGRERDLSQELARAFSGITESDSQASTSLKYKGYEFARARQDTSNIFNSIARRQNVTKGQLLEAYEDASEARFRAFREFNQVVEAVRQFGMKDNDIRRALKEAGVGGINEIIRGVYKPLDVSDSVLDDMRRNGTIKELPRAEIRRMITQQRRRRLNEPLPSEQEPRYEILPPAKEPRYEILPPLQQEGSLQVPTGPVRTAAVSPALLGDNPIDVARNMEIATASR